MLFCLKTEKSHNPEVELAGKGTIPALREPGSRRSGHAEGKRAPMSCFLHNLPYKGNVVLQPGVKASILLLLKSCFLESGVVQSIKTGHMMRHSILRFHMSCLFRCLRPQIADFSGFSTAFAQVCVCYIAPAEILRQPYRIPGNPAFTLQLSRRRSL